MGLPEIEDIKIVREKLDLTLREMAKNTGLSVSWINQVETKKIKHPSYLMIKKIFDFYEFEKSGNERTAGDICVKGKDMKSCYIGSPLKSANKIMIEKDISQVPVFEKDDIKRQICVGMITDKIVTSFVGSDVSDMKINKKMLDIPPPKVDVKTPIRSLKRTLDYFDYVLVEEEGKIIGILARFDLMRTLGEIIKN